MSIKRKITIIVANFYPDISSHLLEGVEIELKKKKFKKGMYRFSWYLN